MSNRSFLLTLLLLLFGGAVSAFALLGKLELPTYPVAEARHDAGAEQSREGTGKPGSGTVANSSSQPAGKSQSKSASGKQPTNTNAPAEKRASKVSEPKFDVVRIDPKGVSVMAGTAEPHSTVEVIADGRKVASAKADATGAWSVATEHRFKTQQPTLKLSALAPGSTPAKATPEAQKTTTKSAANTGSVEDVRAKLLDDLKELVEKSRNDAKMRPKKVARSDTTTTNDATRTAAATNSTGQATTATTVASIPIPILFEFRTANFTSDGKRAAGMLLEYLKQEQLGDITLTGHADERGTETLNMGLSRDRLEAVRGYLKTGGFGGNVALIPKGETAPFTGVDRTKYSGEELWQLDRRVELIINR